MPQAHIKPQVHVKEKLSITRELLQSNFILRGLPDPLVGLILDQGELVELPIRSHIYSADETIENVFFPLSAVLSIVTLMRNGEQIEIGTIGREGVSAFPLIMDAVTTANDCYCQVPGTAIEITATLFHELSLDGTFRKLLNRYLQAYVNMLGQLAACNRLDAVYERCARWLLLTQDRVGRDEIQLTHEYVAMMLGTRRSGVTVAVSTLQRAGFIQTGRARILICDRAGLEQTTCECYKANRLQFDGLAL